MERIQALIDKLYQQRQQNVHPAQLLLTVQLLQSELLQLQHKNGSLGTAKVAVTLPVNMNFSEEVLRSRPESDFEQKEEAPAAALQPTTTATAPAPVNGKPADSRVDDENFRKH